MCHNGNVYAIRMRQRGVFTRHTSEVLYARRMQPRQGNSKHVLMEIRGERDSGTEPRPCAWGGAQFLRNDLITPSRFAVQRTSPDHVTARRTPFLRYGHPAVMYSVQLIAVSFLTIPYTSNPCPLKSVAR